jgi:hypothetical protein
MHITCFCKVVTHSEDEGEDILEIEELIEEEPEPQPSLTQQQLQPSPPPGLLWHLKS